MIATGGASRFLWHAVALHPTLQPNFSGAPQRTADLLNSNALAVNNGRRALDLRPARCRPPIASRSLQRALLSPRAVTVRHLDKCAPTRSPSAPPQPRQGHHRGHRRPPAVIRSGRGPRRRGQLLNDIGLLAAPDVVDEGRVVPDVGLLAAVTVQKDPNETIEG